jgi:hypothetical protein
VRAEAGGIAFALAEDPAGVHLTIPARHLHVVVDRGGVGMIDRVVMLVRLGLRVGFTADDVRGGDDPQRPAAANSCRPFAGLSWPERGLLGSMLPQDRSINREL